MTIRRNFELLKSRKTASAGENSLRCTWDRLFSRF